MAETVTFRPKADLIEDFDDLIEWCQHNNSSFNSVINSFLPAITYAIQNQLYFEEGTNRRFVRADFGDVLLQEPTRDCSLNNK